MCESNFRCNFQFSMSAAHNSGHNKKQQQRNKKQLLVSQMWCSNTQQLDKNLLSYLVHILPWLDTLLTNHHPPNKPALSVTWINSITHIRRDKVHPHSLNLQMKHDSHHTDKKDLMDTSASGQRAERTRPINFPQLSP